MAMTGMPTDAATVLVMTSTMMMTSARLGETLYVHFDRDRTGSIGPVLQVLKDGRYIATGEKNNLAITKLGLKRLEAAMF
jgi:hypothetical protein